MRRRTPAVSALPSTIAQTSRPLEADAAADLYARHSQRIFGYCLGLLRNREEAEDAVQTTFLNAYRGLRRGIRPEFEAAWLFKIAQNVCRTRRENAWRRGRVEAVRDLDALQDIVAAPEHATGQATELTEALKRMPERYRTIILLREWQGLSYREIAAETGLSEGAVEMLVFRARRSLAENLEHADAPHGRVLSLSSALSLLKSLFGGAGVKAVVAAVAVTATAIAVSTADDGRRTPARPAPTKQTVVDRNGQDAGAARSPVVQSTHRVTPEAATVDGSNAPVKPTPAVDVNRPGGGGSQNPPAPPPSSSAPPSAPLSPPAVSVPDVPVPGVSIPTPAVTIPSVSLPEVPPLDLSTPNLPVTPPDLNLP